MTKQRVTDRRLGPQHQPKPRKEEALLSVPERATVLLGAVWEGRLAAYRYPDVKPSRDGSRPLSPVQKTLQSNQRLQSKNKDLVCLGN